MKIPRSDIASHSWLRSANCDASYGWALLAALGSLLAPCVGGEAARTLLRYQRDAIAQGQWWRLVSAHLVHLGPMHALLNGLGLALLWMLFARDYTPRRWAWILCCAGAAIDAGLWWLRPAVEWYVGASGILHGALAAGALSWYRRGDSFGAGLILLLIVKLVYEQYGGASLFMQALPLVPDAHLFGALGGLLGAALPRRAVKSL